MRGAGEESGTGPSPDVEPLTDVYGTDAIAQSHVQLRGRRFRFDTLLLIFKSRDSWSFCLFWPVHPHQHFQIGNQLTNQSILFHSGLFLNLC